MRVTDRGWKLFAGLVLAILIVLLWGSRQPEPPDEIGQHSVLESGAGGSVLVSATVPAFDALVSASVARDTVGISQLITGGAVWSMPSGTPVLVIDRGMYRRLVRFEGGHLAGQTAWVSSDHLGHRSTSK